MSKLMKPLFVNGMFNKEGKRMRVNYLKTIGEYPLWIADGKPDKDYSRTENDKYYLYIEVNDWLIMGGFTEFELEQRTGQDYLNKEWYGDFEGRNKYFDDNFYKGRTYEEYNPLIKEHLEKEELFIEEHGKNGELQAEFLKRVLIAKSIEQYVEARDNNGKYANFVGAAFIGELDKCVEISNKLKEERIKKDKERKAELAKQREIEDQEREQAEKLLIEETEKTFANGGTIKDTNIIIKLADKYNVEIPLRTKGWILNNLSEVTITESGSVSYRYWRRSKAATGSQKVYEVLFNIREAIKGKITA